MSPEKTPKKSEETAAGPLPKKRPRQSWQSFADSLIKQAQRDGDFDNLPGKGKPIPDLDRPYDPMWWCKQLVKRENLPITPGNLSLRRHVEQSLERVWRLPTESEVRRAVQNLNTEIRKANATNVDGPMTAVSVFDEETVVRKWKEGRRPVGLWDGGTVGRWDGSIRIARAACSIRLFD